MIHHVEVQVLVLLLIASLVGMAARKARVPYTLALVSAGLVLGFVRVEALAGMELNKDILLLLFLPALLFEAALHIRVGELRRELVPVLLLALPGVVVATLATAALLWLGLNQTGLAPTFGWSHAFLMASVIAATDPISVLALFRELGVPQRLYLLVEGESLLNDGVAVVVFVIVAAALGIGMEEPGGGIEQGWAGISRFGLRTFITMAGGGIVVGLVIGGAVSAVTRVIDDHLIEVTLTTLVAYGSFLVAEQCHVSGVLSTVCAGIVMGSFGREYGMSVSTRVAVEDFWEYMAFLANSFIFLLVGLKLVPGVLLANVGAIAVAFVAVAIGRAVIIYGGLSLAAFFSDPVPKAWRHVMWWGGLRGSLSMVLVLTLPVGFAGRELLVNLVFGVVAASLFLQGLTMAPLMRLVGLQSQTRERREYERGRMLALASEQALRQLVELRIHGLVDDVAGARLQDHYEARARKGRANAAIHVDGDEVDEQLVDIHRRLIDAERDALREAQHSGVVGAMVGREFAATLDHRANALDHARHLDEAARNAALVELLADDETHGGPG